MFVDPKDSTFPLFQAIEDYPQWAQHVEAELQSQNCYDAISSAKIVVDSNVATLHLTGLGIPKENITSTMLVQ